MLSRVLVAGSVVVLLGVGALALSPRLQFVAGGALVNLGFRLQDPIARLDFVHDEEITPAEVWAEVERQNRMAAAVRRRFPRTARHPLVAMVVCMDARIDTSELTGDTRKYYYVVRTAGSVLSEEEQEMLELAVENGVKLVLLTTHTECAAEKAAATPALRARYPVLTTAVDQRAARIREFMARPAVARRVAAGELLVKLVNIDTMTEAMLPVP